MNLSYYYRYVPGFMGQHTSEYQSSTQMPFKFWMSQTLRCHSIFRRHFKRHLKTEHLHGFRAFQYQTCRVFGSQCTVLLLNTKVILDQKQSPAQHSLFFLSRSRSLDLMQPDFYFLLYVIVERGFSLFSFNLVKKNLVRLLLFFSLTQWSFVSLTYFVTIK